MILLFHTDNSPLRRGWRWTKKNVLGGGGPPGGGPGYDPGRDGMTAQPDGLPNHAPGQTDISGVGGGDMATTQGFGGDGGGGFDWRDIPREAWDFIKNNPGIVLAAGSAILNARQGQESDALRDEAVQMARRDQDARFEQRGRVLGGDLTRPNIQRPDLSSAFADPGNPFATPLDRTAITGVGGGGSGGGGGGGGPADPSFLGGGAVDAGLEKIGLDRTDVTGVGGSGGGGTFLTPYGPVQPGQNAGDRLLERMIKEREARKAAEIQGVR